MQPNEIQVVHIANETIDYRDVAVPHPSPTGAQILAEYGATGQQDVLLQVLPSGDLECIRPTGTPNLTLSRKFIVGEGDRVYFFTVDEARLEWPGRNISAAAIRKLANVPMDRDLMWQPVSGELVTLEPTDMIDLGKAGVESIVSGPHKWKLRVQGVHLTYTTPHVKVADAMKDAGFDPTKAWNIFLLVAGEEKKVVESSFVVDLRTPGIEKIRLMQRNVDNGEGHSTPIRQGFQLLPADERYLNALGLVWSTIVDGERRWLVIESYSLLPGYTPSSTRLALDIPKDYPTAQIDMFYFSPTVARSDGQPIPSTQVTATIEGVTFQGWSRHRNQVSPWDPYTDNVVTHMALVEHSLAREFGE